MSEKRLIGIVIIIFIITVFNLIVAVSNFSESMSYWDSDISSDGKIIFKIRNASSFNGDGIRYKVIEYNADSKWYTYTFNELEDPEIEKLTLELLDNIEEPILVSPDFSSPYVWMKEEKLNNILIILKFPDSNRVFIIEQFI